VDYVSLGPAYETSSKADVPSPRPLELFAELARTLPVPLVAIGGIGPDNVAPLAAAGVSAVAALSALYQGEDVEKAASGLIEAFRDAP